MAVLLEKKPVAVIVTESACVEPCMTVVLWAVKSVYAGLLAELLLIVLKITCVMPALPAELAPALQYCARAVPVVRRSTVRPMADRSASKSERAEGVRVSMVVEVRGS